VTTERDYLEVQVRKLGKHVEKRLCALQAPRKVELLKEKIERKRAVVAEKNRKVTETRRRVQAQRDRREGMQGEIDLMVESLGASKTQLE
jgi:hypothetical protein